MATPTVPTLLTSQNGGRWGIAAPVVVGVALRLLVPMLFSNMGLTGDEINYVRGAEEIIAGEHVSDLPMRPPLYFYFCALVFKLFGASANNVRIVQALLEGLTILGVYAIAARTLGIRAACRAAWIYALLPDFIAFSHYLWSESLFLFVLVQSLLALIILQAQPSFPMVLVAGFLLGLSTLLKPYQICLAPFLLGWFVYTFERPARCRALAAAVGVFSSALLVVLPWVVYISLKHDRIVPVADIGRLNLRVGVNYYEPPQFDFPPKPGRWSVREWILLSGTQGRREGLVSFIASNPRLFVERSVEKMSYLWSPNSFLIRHVYSADHYGSPNAMHRSVRLAVTYAVMIANLVVITCFVLGFFSSNERYLRGLTAAYVVPYMLMICLTPSMSRYRLPLMIFAVVFASLPLGGGADMRRFLRRRQRLIAPGIILAALVLLWSMRIPEILSAAW